MTCLLAYYLTDSFLSLEDHSTFLLKACPIWTREAWRLNGTRLNLSILHYLDRRFCPLIKNEKLWRQSVVAYTIWMIMTVRAYVLALNPWLAIKWYSCHAHHLFLTQANTRSIWNYLFIQLFKLCLRFLFMALDLYRVWLGSLCLLVVKQ